MAELERIGGGEYAPPMAEDVNTLGRYPYTMACLLAHIASDGAIESNDLRQKIHELSQGEAIRQSLEGRTLTGSRIVLQSLGLLKIEGIEPELVTSTTDASIRRAMPLIGVLGSLYCDVPMGADIRPIFDITANSAWNMHIRLKFFDLLAKSTHGLYGTAVREQLGMTQDVFYDQMVRFEEVGVIVRHRFWEGSKPAGTKLSIAADYSRPLANLVGRYAGLWSEPGRRSAAKRAYAILERPAEFAQLLNTGPTPHRDVSKVLCSPVESKSLAQRKMDRWPESLPGVDVATTTVLDQLGGRPLEMAYLLAHCRHPMQWLSDEVVAQRIGFEWATSLSRSTCYMRLLRTPTRLNDLQMLEHDTNNRTRLTPQGILTGAPTIGILADWLLSLPPDINVRKLLEIAPRSLSKSLTVLSAISDHGDEKIYSFRSAMGSDRDSVLLRRLCAAGIVDMQRSGLFYRIQSLQIVPDERPFIDDLLKKLRSLQDEDTAVEVFAQIIANVRTDNYLGEVAMISRGNGFWPSVDANTWYFLSGVDRPAGIQKLL